MPRYARRALANVTYHIIHRGNNKQVIFFCDDDFQYFLRLIKIAKTEYEMNLYSYVLMNNHVHFLLEPLVKEHLAKFIKSIAQKYAQYVNKKYKRTGTLWEGRFRSSPVSMDNYLLACSRYIEMNPARAGITRLPGDYKWSSYNGKIGFKADPLLDFDSWFLSLGSNEDERQKKYEKWFKESIPDFEWKLITESVNKGVAFGNDVFKEKIENILGRKMQIRRRGRPFKEENK
ncbi:transposase [Candidatus Desantisbacteria bacterium CG_4_10_14_0_8_um_filter_48_22]|uniref:Transposase n=1 Tax=Candidatus Desantisbacteria bacterium CG_4_10_14_0_8_um_filter_48_22 TaxID=1974543 RepID=A0A2M7SCK0_9BACT|nr:MAG: hypothetical protein AUJ67_08875 [Candidatus Desantisbacteria bacterium CG1_02_49_89]PIV54766.1 MAG: transposase [Candidatus Desantisbacteria bacterium CG02_land_8_20_14_3_00_49_13]PIZ16993.1 MAG: transposase [Candidatus Desantisbacteria bacterium CG_4_10_14_0_8_um_filter_48_22]